jgi:hypothetical protein
MWPSGAAGDDGHSAEAAWLILNGLSGYSEGTGATLWLSLVGRILRTCSCALFLNYAPLGREAIVLVIRRQGCGTANRPVPSGGETISTNNGHNLVLSGPIAI